MRLRGSVFLSILLFGLSAECQIKKPAQHTAPAVSQKQLIAWNIGGKADARIASELKRRSIGFVATPEVIAWFRATGVSPSVISSLASVKQSEKVIGFDPEAETYRRAAELKQKGSLEGAYNLIKSTNEATFEYHFALAGILRSAEQWDAARKEFQDASNFDPRSIDALTGLAYADYRLGLGEAAKQAAEKAVALDPNDSDSHKFLGLALQSLADYVSAEREYKKAVELDPRNAAAYYDLGITLNENGNKQGAIAAYQQATKIDPTQFEYFYNLGIVLAENGDRAQAVDAYKTAKQLNPNELRVRNNLTATYCEMARYQETIAEANELLKIDPEWNMIRPCLAKAQYAINDEDGAIKTEEAYLGQEPGDVKVTKVLLQHYLGRKRFTEAQALAERLIENAAMEQVERSEEYADALEMAASVRQYQNDWKGAEPLIAKALTIYETYPALKFGKYREALAYHASTLKQLGRTAEALAEEKRASDLQGQQLAMGTSAREKWESLNNAARGAFQNPGAALSIGIQAYQQAKLIKEDGAPAVKSATMLAFIYRRVQQPDQALKIAKDVLAFEEANFPQTLSHSDALLLLESNLDRAEPGVHKERIRLLEKSAQMRKNGSDEQFNLMFTGRLAQAYLDDGQKDRALPLMKKALTDSEKAYGAENINVVPYVDHLAAFYLSDAQWSLAEPFFKRSLALYEKQWGPQHPPLAGILWQLTTIEEKLGHPQEAQAYKNRADAIQQAAARNASSGAN